jgi:hypothetical protein
MYVYRYGKDMYILVREPTGQLVLSEWYSIVHIQMYRIIVNCKKLINISTCSNVVFSYGVPSWADRSSLPAVDTRGTPETDDKTWGNDKFITLTSRPSVGLFSRFHDSIFLRV